MVDAETFLQMGRDVIAGQPFSALIGERLIAPARAVHVSKSQAVCRCEVFAIRAGAGKLCALAQGTIAKLAEAPARPDATDSR